MVDEIAITGHDDLEEETTTEAVSRLELETKAQRRFASRRSFNQEKALVGAFYVITNLRVDLCLKLSSKALDLLISYRPSKEQFPIIVTQDCGHAETR